MLYHTSTAAFRAVFEWSVFMKRLISVLVLAFSFAAFAQGSAPAPAGDKPAATEKTEKGEKSEKSDKKAKKAKKAEKEGEKKPETAK